MKKVLILIFSMWIALPVWAQMDEKRMQRDLDIAKNILSSLMSEDGNSLISGRRIDANYVDGFGVIIKIPQNTFFFNYNYANPKPMRCLLSP